MSRNHTDGLTAEIRGPTAAEGVRCAMHARTGSVSPLNDCKFAKNTLVRTDNADAS